MEILEHGKNYGKKLEFRCPLCGCRFVAAPAEYDRWSETQVSCECPECGSVVEVEE